MRLSQYIFLAMTIHLRWFSRNREQNQSLQLSNAIRRVMNVVQLDIRKIYDKKFHHQYIYML